MIKKGDRVEFNRNGSVMDGVAESDETATHVNVRTAPPNGIPGWGIVAVPRGDVIAYGWQEI